MWRRRVVSITGVAVLVAPSLALAEEPSASADVEHIAASVSIDPDRPTELYRTVCVRACDGYFWPVSERARADEFVHDEAMCKASCATDARLFLLPVGSRRIAAARDLQGEPYTALPNAFVFRQALVPGCGCKPAPWSRAAARRHATYASEAQAATTPPPPAKGPEAQASSGEFHATHKTHRDDTTMVAAEAASTPAFRAGHSGSLGQARMLSPAEISRSQRRALRTSARGLIAW